VRSGRDSREVSAGSWEKFAQEDPYTYILTSLESNDPGEFWPSGQRTVQQELLPLLGRHRTPLTSYHRYIVRKAGRSSVSQ
jgi:hypothetical protein